jgi:hypothetical protein
LSDNLGKESGYVRVNNTDVAYHDVEHELRKKATSELRHQSSPVFSGRVAYEPWHDIDCTYLFCAEDAAIPIALQEMMASLLPENAPKFSLKASHSPFLSMPRETAETLGQIANIGRERTRA